MLFSLLVPEKDRFKALLFFYLGSGCLLPGESGIWGRDMVKNPLKVHEKNRSPP